MSGWLTNGIGLLAKFTGLEQLSADTGYAGGQNPQTAAFSLMQIAAAAAFLTNSASKTVVAGSRYIVDQPVGQAMTVTGVNVLVGSTGGTDKWIAELHDSAGLLVATSALAGATTGTAGTYQQLAFTAPVSIAPGTYYIAIQTNGTTATLGTLNSPTSPHVTGSATGVFGTSASITPPTTYTANLGPLASLY